MMIMTARLSKAKIAAAVGVLLIAVGVLTAVVHGNAKENHAENPSVKQKEIASNEDRIEYLASYGWETEEKPIETQEIVIPEEMNEVYARYNELQKSQGFDLTAYAGKQAKRYVYQITNYPNADKPVYATLLIYHGNVIGGDITSTCGKGFMHGFTKPAASFPIEEEPAA